MAHYRLYCIDKRGGFFRCEDIEADADEEAIDKAVALHGGHAAELWSGARFVRVFAAATSELRGDAVAAKC
jgi:hypothetical protein